VIRVLIVDDHPFLRAGLEQLLASAPDVTVVGNAADGEEAVALAGDRKADVVLMDIEMPGVDGIDATRRILAADADVHVVVLTSFSDRRRIFDALDAGAIGYLLKDADADELFRGIRAAARGEAPLAPKVAAAVLAARSDAQRAELTAREREVLGLVRTGLPNKLIARRLGISERTVKAHLTSVFQAIGVTDRTQAALWAEQRGL
jgi:DNA-binding NarL/FixJ family response regulator